MHTRAGDSQATTQPGTRIPDEREYCHERLGDDYDRSLSLYDTRRRVEVLIDEFLTDESIAGKQVLDVGCGLGFFSKRLSERGAQVVACDLGPGLVERTKKLVGCKAVVADALALSQVFGLNAFDVVVSSECIEHTPSPATAVAEMAKVLKSGGYLSLSTPNRLWQPVLRLATALRLRPFDGFENFTSWGSMRRMFSANGVEILREKGLHLFPFQFGLHGLSGCCDCHLQGLRALMINICVLGKKGGR